MKPLLLLGAALLCACATTTTWSHASKTRQDLYKDRAACSAQAGQATAGVADPLGGFRRQVFLNCMYGEGWTLQE